MGRFGPMTPQTQRLDVLKSQPPPTLHDRNDVIGLPIAASTRIRSTQSEHLLTEPRSPAPIGRGGVIDIPLRGMEVSGGEPSRLGLDPPKKLGRLGRLHLKRFERSEKPCQPQAVQPTPLADRSIPLPYFRSDDAWIGSDLVLVHALVRTPCPSRMLDQTPAPSTGSHFSFNLQIQPFPHLLSYRHGDKKVLTRHIVSPYT